MRILFVGNRNLKHKGARYYDPGAKLYNGLVRNGHNVYWMSDRDVARSANMLGIKSLGIKSCNKYYLEVCKNFLPEFVVFYHADIISVETIAKSKKLLPDVKMVQFNVDPIYRPHNIKMVHDKTPVMDGTFITTAGPELATLSKNNCFTAFIPNPIDSSIEWPKAFEKSDQEYDVFWSVRAPKGSYGGDPRIEFPLYVEDSGKAKIQYYGMNGKQSIYNAEYHYKLANSKMGLNISAVRDFGFSQDIDPKNVYLYSSDRISHYMGSGLLTLIKRGFSLEEMFIEDEQAVYFDTKEEMLEKIVYYKNNDEERKKIAHAGWKKSHEELNERLVAQYLVESSLDLKLSHSYAWPVDKY